MKSAQVANRLLRHSRCIHSTRPPRLRTRLNVQTSPFRTITTYTTPTSRVRGWVKDAQKDYPILFPVLLVGCLASLSLLGLLTYDELTRVAPAYSAYPTGVEQRLRVALHFTHVQPDPEQAEAHFIEALKQADDAKMDPFSKEVMGIRIRYAEMLEHFGRVKGAVGLLEGIIKDCESRLREVDAANEMTPEVVDLRTSLLRGIIQSRAKTAALYETEYLQDPEKAKQTLSDAVALLVKETRDPQGGFSEDNAVGLQLSEIASLLSQMGDLYATTGEESNAVQVYMLTLQPLRKSCNGTRSCKEVQILSNIASTMAVAMKRPGATINGKPPTPKLLDAARRATMKWADQAIGAVKKVNPAERDQMCELGLVSAEMTKADMLLDAGEKQQASDLLRSLIPRLEEQNLHALVKIAQQNLQKATS